MFHYFHSTQLSYLTSGISVRTIFAVLTSFLLTMVLVPIVIKKIKERRVGQSVRSDGPESHLVKTGRPTMGGIAMIIALVVTCLIWTKLNIFIILVLTGTIWLAIIGFVDDLFKFLYKNSDGISAKTKLIGQGLFGILLGIYIMKTGILPSTLNIPIINYHLELGWLYVIFVTFVIVGTSNAVNLTDGLDGLAIGIIAIVSGTYGGIAYITGNSIFSEHVNMEFISGSGELTVFCAALVGAALGFLWYNAPPAEIFMGDIGSLSLGGAIGTVAVLTKTELLLVVIGGIFVLEAVSVILQVISYRMRKRRIFKMAPIHHHFELSGWAESKVVVRFYIITIILTLGGLSLIGLNVLFGGR